MLGMKRVAETINNFKNIIFIKCIPIGIYYLEIYQDNVQYYIGMRKRKQIED